MSTIPNQIILFILPLQSYAMNGNDMYKFCTHQELQFRTLCIGYVGGYLDTYKFVNKVMNAYEVDHKGYLHPHCIPKNLKLMQLKDLVVKYLEETPDKRNLDAAVIVNFVISSVSKCESEKPGE